jgi:hypothetical protein
MVQLPFPSQVRDGRSEWHGPRVTGGLLHPCKYVTTRNALPAATLATYANVSYVGVGVPFYL